MKTFQLIEKILVQFDNHKVLGDSGSSQIYNGTRLWGQLTVNQCRDADPFGCVTSTGLCNNNIANS